MHMQNLNDFPHETRELMALVMETAAELARDAVSKVIIPRTNTMPDEVWEVLQGSRKLTEKAVIAAAELSRDQAKELITEAFKPVIDAVRGVEARA